MPRFRILPGMAMWYIYLSKKYENGELLTITNIKIL